MSSLLKDTYDKMEGIKGKKLLYTFLAIFIVFTLIGVSIGYLMSPKLNKDENETPKENYSGKVQESKKIEAEGRVTYVNPEMYPMDDVSYSLTDNSGKDIYLLKSKDQKLQISEGLSVKVIGVLGKLKDNKTEVLLVEEVIIKSATD